EVDLPSKGYLNIVAMGARDSAATVLFPNQHEPDNLQEAGRVHIPNASTYVLSQEVSGQPEDNELIVIFTSRELNLYKSGTGKEAFRKMTESTRGTVVRAAPGMSAGLVTYRINPK